MTTVINAPPDHPTPTLKATIFSLGVDFDSVYVDCMITEDWTVPRVIWDLMNMVGEEHAERQRVYDAMPPEPKRVVQRMTGALQGIAMRVRFNTHTRGPFTLFHEQDITKDDLVAWYMAQRRQGEPEPTMGRRR
jgi:hypothetical protein